MLIMNTNPAAIPLYIIGKQQEINLLLHHFSSIFDIPSFFNASPFLIAGAQSTRTVPSVNNQSFSNYQYWTITHPFLADDDNPRTRFRVMYRMDLSSFESLVNDLSQHPVFDLRAHNSIPAYIQISCAIWWLANCHIGYRTSNIAFGVSHGSYINFFRRTLVAIEGVYGNKISWPMDQERVQAIHIGFEWPHGQREGAIRRLPNVIGGLDGKNVIIKSPRVHPEQWRDRKGHFAMKLTAVCDNKCRFIYIRVGDSGRTHDAAAFKWTEVFTMFLRRPRTFFRSDEYILADSACPLSRHIIVPYPITDTTGNTPDAIAKRKFNKAHSSARMTIDKKFMERAIGYCLQSFKRL